MAAGRSWLMQYTRSTTAGHYAVYQAHCSSIVGQGYMSGTTLYSHLLCTYPLSQRKGIILGGGYRILKHMTQQRECIPNALVFFFPILHIFFKYRLS